MEQPKLPARRRLNLVVVGKSGVGKSSFLNYAAGRPVFEVGSGDSVTADYFDSVEVDTAVPGLKLALFDTKGIEVDNTDEWSQRIFDEIKMRDTSSDLYDWFHTIIYCISAGDKRIEPFELNAIRHLMRYGSVLVLLTKKDQATDEQLSALRRHLLTELGTQVQVLSVCNGARTRLGDTPPSGLEDVLRASFLGLWEKLARTVPNVALANALQMDAEFAMKPTLPNLLALMALTAASGNIFPEIPEVARMMHTPVVHTRRALKKAKLLGEDYFRQALANVRGAVTQADNGMVSVSYVSPQSLTLSMPANLNRGALHYKFYRRAVLAWIPRWSALSVELLMRLRTGEVSQRFREVVNATVTEVMTFYNDITTGVKRPLMLHRTDEMLARIDAVAGNDGSAKELQYRLDLLEDAIHRCGRLTAGRAERMNAQATYMSVLRVVDELNHALGVPFKQLTEALQTELRAYGQYCLRDDELAMPASML